MLGSVAIHFDAKDPLELALVVDGEAIAEIRHEALTEALVVVHDDGVVNPHEEPEDGPRRRDVRVEAHIDGGLRKAPRCDEFGEQLPPHPASLLQAIDAAVELHDEATSIGRTRGKAWGHGHVEVLIQLALKKRLLYIDRR